MTSAPATQQITATQTARGEGSNLRFQRGDRVLVRAGNIAQRNVCREARVTEAPTRPSGIYLLQLTAGGWLCAYQRDIEADPDFVDILTEGIT